MHAEVRSSDKATTEKLNSEGRSAIPKEPLLFPLEASRYRRVILGVEPGTYSMCPGQPHLVFPEGSDVSCWSRLGAWVGVSLNAALVQPFTRYMGATRRERWIMGTWPDSHCMKIISTRAGLRRSMSEQCFRKWTGCRAHLYPHRSRVEGFKEALEIMYAVSQMLAK